MKQKNTGKWSLIFLGIEGILLTLMIIFLLIPNLSLGNFYKKPTLFINNQTPKKPLRVTFSGSSQPGLPLNLSIPKIRLNVSLEHIGLTTQGEMAVPDGIGNAGWYNLGPRPGEKGNAVIDGHYGVWKNGNVWVFNYLHKLKKGDTLSIKDDKGVTTTFVVRETRLYNQNSNASDIFVSKDGGSHLNIITCQGVWNKKTKSYPSRLVVFTDKEVK